MLTVVLGKEKPKAMETTNTEDSSKAAHQPTQ